MNNKGFTLIEVLCVIVLSSIVITIVFTTFGTTFSATKDEKYKIMKNNLLTAGYNYINECKLGTVKCDFSFEDNNRFSARDLYNNGYFKTLESPIDGKNLGSCIILEATKDNGVVSINLIDNCYSSFENNIPVIKDDESTESSDINLENPDQNGNGNSKNENNKNNGNKNKGSKNEGSKNKDSKNKDSKNKDDKQNIWNEIIDIMLDMINEF